MEAQEIRFQHARKDHAKCQLQQEVGEGDSLKVSIGFSHKIVINNLAENSFSGVIRAKARVKWVEQRMESKEAERQNMFL